MCTSFDSLTYMVRKNKKKIKIKKIWTQTALEEEKRKSYLLDDSYNTNTAEKRQWQKLYKAENYIFWIHLQMLKD